MVLVAALALVLALTPLMVACDSGTVSPPSVQKLEENARIVDLRLETGEVITCLFYSSKGESGYQGYSWLILDCEPGIPRMEHLRILF